MKKLMVMVAAAVSAAVASANDVAEIKAKIERDCKVIAVDRFHGFDRVVFDFRGYEAWVVCPEGGTREGRPWTWCMQWATAFVPRTNVPQMLRDGYHHVTINTFVHRMDETGLRVSAAFQDFLVNRLGFAKKAYLIGMSWGGFFSIRYANRYPQSVAKAYLDAPLLCFQDHRAGIGPWERVEPADGWTKSPEMPINMAESIAAADIPLLILYGGKDRTCPPEFNCEPFIARFRAAGGDLAVVKRGLYAHHPHGVELDDNLIKVFFERPKTLPIANCPGELGSANGWKTAGVGCFTGPEVRLDKTATENACYRLTFQAKGESDGCWRADMADGDGRSLPDVRGRIAASADWTDCAVLVPTRPDAMSVSLSFCSEKPLAVRDVCLKRISLPDADEMARTAYAAGPKLRNEITAKAWELLPNTRIAIKVAKDYSIVFLGDAMANGVWNAGIGALVAKEYPDTDFRFFLSARDGTEFLKCRERTCFDASVGRHKPNFVVVCSSGRLDGAMSAREAEDALAEIVAHCKAIGAEVAICAPSASAEFDGAAAAERVGVQFWDLTTDPRATDAEQAKALDGMLMFLYFNAAQK